MIEGLPQYRSVVDSHQPWLGDVPSHWDVLPALAVYRPNETKNTGMIEDTVLSLSYGRIIIKPKDKLHGLVPESFETYQVVEPGDIIVRTTDLQNDRTSLRIGQVKDRGIITSAYTCLRTTDRLNPEYGYQFLNAFDLTKAIYGYGSGLRQSLGFRHIKRMPVLIPPPDEQAAIVKFLGHANRKIGRYIQAKRKLIKLLEEQKRVIIHRAVTRGLDLTTKVKPTGLKWVGDVPEHWDVRPAKYFFREVDERSVTGSEELLSVSHLVGVKPRATRNITMFKAASYVGHKLCRPDDLVINTMWAWMGALGVSALTGIVSSSYAVYRPLPGSGLIPRFAELLLRSWSYIAEYHIRSTGIRSSRLRFYPDQFLHLNLVCPPTHEQLAIISEVDSATLQLSTAISQAREEIELMKEYQTRLTTDVVTGKFDVRAAAANLPDMAPEEKIEDEDLVDDEDLGEEEQ